MNNDVLIAKEKELAISRLKHSILEQEVKLLKKLEEVDRIKENIKSAKDTLNKKLEE